LVITGFHFTATFAMHTRHLGASIAYSVEADILGATDIKVSVT